MDNIEEMLRKARITKMEDQTIPSKIYTYPERTACQVLEEMRALIKNANAYSYDRIMMTLPSMIEELQIFYNRMEACLGVNSDLNRGHDKLRKIKKLHNSLREECKELKKEIERLEDDKS